MEKNLIEELYSDSIEMLNEKIGDDLPSPYPVLIFNLPPEESCRNGACQNKLTCGFYSPENGLIGLNDVCYGFNGPDEFGLHEYVHKIKSPWHQITLSRAIYSRTNQKSAWFMKHLKTFIKNLAN